MPAYPHQFTNIADIETAYAEAYTVKTVFTYSLWSRRYAKTRIWEEAKVAALESKKVIAADMKNEKRKTSCCKWKFLK